VTSRSDTVVVGGSVAAVTFASELRRLGYDQGVTLLSDEMWVPYARPPLSKGVLTGADTVESVSLPPFDDDVCVRLGARATGLDLDRRRVLLSEGDDVPFDKLFIATGARARTLRQESATPETVLRTVEDCLSLRDQFARRPSVVIVGGGFLGMELASSCRGLGLATTVVDLGAPLVVQLGPFLASVLTAAALDAGVQVLQSPSGVDLLGGSDRIEGVQLEDGTRVEGDLVLTAVGCRPNVEWLAGSGLSTAGGVLVDQRCQVAEGVFAAGDVASSRHGSALEARRTPHFTHAVEQARAAAVALVMGHDAPPYRPAAYFWTEQFGLTVKLCGRLPLMGVPHLLAGSLRERHALLQWRDGGLPVGSASINHRMPIKKLRALAAA
jgi:NADPH-dependent 2,4-dienoyl-CoA reductase/sulfur reductase-like enzyme